MPDVFKEDIGGKICFTCCGGFTCSGKTSSKNWVVILLFYLLWRFHLQWQDIIQDVGGDVIIFTYSGGFPSEQDITQDLGGDINMLNSSDGN